MEPTGNDQVTPPRRIVNALLVFSQEIAESKEMERRMMENLFLLGISIGRAQQLTSEERRAYARTFTTAEFLTLLEEPSLSNMEHVEHNRENIANAVKNWLGMEPEVRKSLEQEFGWDFSSSGKSSELPPSMRNTILKTLHAIAEASPGTIGEEEVNSIMEKLEHPLDRP